MVQTSSLKSLIDKYHKYPFKTSLILKVYTLFKSDTINFKFYPVNMGRICLLTILITVNIQPSKLISSVVVSYLAVHERDFAIKIHFVFFILGVDILGFVRNFSFESSSHWKEIDAVFV